MTRKDTLCLTAFTLLGCVLSAALKYELTWDFLHYHYYNGFAAAYGRLGYDVAPAGLNTYFNPLLDALTFWLTDLFNDSPNVYYALTGAPFGLLLFAVFKINALFFKSPFAIGISVLLAATGFATWFQIGTSTNEIPVALLVLTGLYFLLTDTKTAAAGLLLGAAMGLKATAGVYCLSSGIVFIAFHRREYKRIVLFTLAGIGGFLLTNGFWMYKLQILFQNPFFPFFNAVFKSPYFETVNYSFRAVFADRSVAEALLLPFSFIGHFRPSYAANASFSDIRLALGLILFCACAPFVKKHPISRQTAFLAAWAGVSYIVWLVGFSVIRYLIPVEVLLPVFFVKTAAFWRPKQADVLKESLFYSACVVLFAACVGTVFVSNPWGSRRHQARVFESPDFRLPENAVAAGVNTPNGAYLAAIAKKTPSVRLVSLFRDQSGAVNPWHFTKNSLLAQKARAYIEASSPAYVITTPIPLNARPKGTLCRETGGIFSAAKDMPETSFAAFEKKFKRAPFFQMFCAPEDLNAFAAPWGLTVGKDSPVFEDAL